MTALVHQRSPDVSLARACEAVGLNRTSLYRCKSTTPSSARAASSPVRRIADVERDVIYALLTSDEFADQPPHEVHAALLSRGTYHCSVRSMYRILHERNAAVHERRKQRRPHSFAAPHLVATAPNQVWVWDITKLPGSDRSSPLFLYSAMDLFSRYVVGWMVADVESAALARQFLAEAYARHGVKPSTLTTHSDRGAPMTSRTVAELLVELGVARSFSRPRTSNDNAAIESSFKTMKYQPTFPVRFTSLLAARAWLETYFDWYHREHHHIGLALFTPEQVFTGRVEDIAAIRQRALDDAFQREPLRFSAGRPQVRRPPTRVEINPLSTTPPIELDDSSLN